MQVTYMMENSNNSQYTSKGLSNISGQLNEDVSSKFNKRAVRIRRYLGKESRLNHKTLLF